MLTRQKSLSRLRSALASDNFGVAMRLFGKDLKSALKAHSVSQQQLAEVLRVTRQTVSNKISCTTPWTAQELMLLSETFGVPLQNPYSAMHSIQLTPGYVAEGSFCLDAYLSTLEREFLPSRRPQVRLDVISTDLPVFYLLPSLELLAFETYNYAVSRASDAEVEPFGEAWIEEVRRHHPRAKAIAELYLNTHRREVWGANPIGSICRRIERHRGLGYIVPEMLRSLISGLSALLSSLGEHYLTSTEQLQLRYNADRSRSTIYCASIGSTPVRAHVTYNDPYYFVADSPVALGFLKDFTQSAWRSSERLPLSTWRAYEERMKRTIARLAAGC